MFLPSEGLGTMNTAADPELFARLVDGVKHEDEQICLTYARMLSNAFPDRAPDIILERMQHASAPLCDQLVRLIGPELPEELLHRLESTRDLGDAHERATVLTTRFEARDARMQAQVEPCFASEQSADRRVRRARCVQLRSRRAARSSPSSNGSRCWRIRARRSIYAALHLGQKLAMPASFLPHLCDLLGHADDGVKKAALAALRHSAIAGGRAR